MANLGYSSDPALMGGSRRQIAGYGGNDEYAGSSGGGSVAVDPPAPVTPTPTQPRGFAELGYGDAALQAATALPRTTMQAATFVPSQTKSALESLNDSSAGRAAKGISKWLGENYSPFGLVGSLTGYTAPKTNLEQTREDLGEYAKPRTDAEVSATIPPKPRTDAEVSATIPPKPIASGSSGDIPSSPEGIASPFSPSVQPAQSSANAEGLGQMGPAFGSSGVLTGLTPSPSVMARAGDEETDADIAEFNKKQEQIAAEKTAKAAPKEEPKSVLPEGLKTNLDTGAKSKELSPKERFDKRDKLLKMSGENVAANDQIALNRASAAQRRTEMRNEWNEAQRLASSGNLSEREYGLRKQAELEREGMSRGFLQQGVGAQEAYKKFTTNPYNVEQVNRIRQEEGLAAQAQAQAAKAAQEAEAAARKEKMEEDKFKFEKDKEEARKAERIQEREDKLNEKFQERIEKLADTKDQREYEMKKSELESEQRMAEYASKFSKLTGRMDRDQKAMLTERMHNEAQQGAAQAVRSAIEEARKYTGIFGKARAWYDGKDRDAEISKVVDSYERHLKDQQKRFDEIGKIYGVQIPHVDFDRQRIENAIRRKGPENSDDLIATFQDLAKVGEFGIKYLTPAGRAGTAFGMAANSGQVPAPMAAPFIPQQQNIDYTRLLSQ